MEKGKQAGVRKRMMMMRMVLMKIMGILFLTEVTTASNQSLAQIQSNDLF